MLCQEMRELDDEGAEKCASVGVCLFVFSFCVCVLNVFRLFLTYVSSCRMEAKSKDGATRPYTLIFAYIILF